jgi:hypothetical protein
MRLVHTMVVTMMRMRAVSVFRKGDCTRDKKQKLEGVGIGHRFFSPGDIFEIGNWFAGNRQ